MLEKSGIPEQQVVRGDRKACPGAGCQPADLLSKVASAREDHLMPAQAQETLEHPEHRCPFRGKAEARGLPRLSSQKYLHYHTIGAGSDLMPDDRSSISHRPSKNYHDR